LNKNHSYIIYSVEKCTEAKRNTNPSDPTCEADDCEPMDPPCAPLAEINEWLVGKKSMMLVTQFKPDFAFGK